jgi:hypothetical protein
VNPSTLPMKTWRVLKTRASGYHNLWVKLYNLYKVSPNRLISHAYGQEWPWCPHRLEVLFFKNIKTSPCALVMCPLWDVVDGPLWDRADGPLWDATDGPFVGCNGCVFETFAMRLRFETHLVDGSLWDVVNMFLKISPRDVVNGLWDAMKGLSKVTLW